MVEGNLNERPEQFGTNWKSKQKLKKYISVIERYNWNQCLTSGRKEWTTTVNNESTNNYDMIIDDKLAVATKWLITITNEQCDVS